MLAAQAEAAPSEEPPKAPTPPPPAGKVITEIQKCLSDIYILDDTLEATENHPTADYQRAVPFFCFVFLSHQPSSQPPSVPTSAPQNVSVDDVNESSLTIKWKTPETIGDSGLDGYIIEYCKDGSKLCYCVRVHVQLHLSPQQCQGADRVMAALGPYTAGSMSLYLLRPLLALPVCLDDSMASEISLWWPKRTL